jgi:hypothetical protein
MRTEARRWSDLDAQGARLPQNWSVMKRYLAAACLGALLLPVVGSGQASPLDYDGAFVFTRIRYGSGFGRGGSSWAHDYPRADRHLPRIIAELTTLSALT